MTERILSFRNLIYGEPSSHVPQACVGGAQEGHNKHLPGPALSLNCEKCHRFLLVGELYSDGYTDTETLCHSCQKTQMIRDNRHYESMLKRAGNAVGWDRESTENYR